MVLSDLIYQDWPYTGRSTVSYIVFYQGWPIYHCTHVPCPVAQYSAEIEHNAACTTGIALGYFRMLNNELLNRDLYAVLLQKILIILDIKSDICMSKYGNNNKHTRKITE